ncbi:MAG: hypothetical protein CMJ46_15325 [Planctomyces sp.]|nr:hypothetical protein [Planctomyces sp.]
MDSYIPFVYNTEDLMTVKQHFPKARMLRTTSSRAKLLQTTMRGEGFDIPLWVDGEFDGFHRLPSRVDPKWQATFYQLDLASELVRAESITKRDEPAVKRAAFSILDACHVTRPDAISVPQLPITPGAARNPLNRYLAKATAEWRVSRNFTGSLVLPIILADRHLKLTKELSKPVVANAAKRYKESGATAYWVVDTKLDDMSGSQELMTSYLPKLIEFHTMLDGAIGGCHLRIGGPYWGANLVLWARDLIDAPAISAGKGFRYHIPAGYKRSSDTSWITLTPLRRRIRVSDSLRVWLGEALEIIDSDSDAYKSLNSIYSEFQLLQDKKYSINQVASSYARWLSMLEEKPSEGRALTLYMDLSSAYVIGRTLPRFPKKETPVNPSRVAETLMLSCL